MTRRNFIATAAAAVASSALPEAPKAEEPITLQANPVPPGWKVVGYTYLFGRDAGARCYGRTFFSTDSYGSVTGVGTQELLGTPGFIELPR